MKKLIFATLMLGVCLFTSHKVFMQDSLHAQEKTPQEKSPIATRQAIFDAIDAKADDVAKMLQGQAKFDLAEVKKTLALFQDSAQKLPTLFPDPAQNANAPHEKTGAKPAIWQEKDKFVQLFAEFQKKSQAAGAAITDEASFKREMPSVLGSCISCHKLYRGRKS